MSYFSFFWILSSNDYICTINEFIHLIIKICANNYYHHLKYQYYNIVIKRKDLRTRIKKVFIIFMLCDDIFFLKLMLLN